MQSNVAVWWGWTAQDAVPFVLVPGLLGHLHGKHLWLTTIMNVSWHLQEVCVNDLHLQHSGIWLVDSDGLRQISDFRT